MSLLDDARRLAEGGPPTYEDMFCLLCDAQVVAFGVNPVYPAGPHRIDCPWPAMPRIVAALEAAGRIANDSPLDSKVAQGGAEVEACKFCYGEFAHEADCPWQALVAAMRGEPEP